MDVNDVMHQKGTRRILGILKKSVELSLAIRRRRGLSLARGGLATGVHVCVWGGGGQMEKPE